MISTLILILLPAVFAQSFERGVSLADLAAYGKKTVAFSATAYVKKRRLKHVSISFVSRDADRQVLTADVLALDPKFRNRLKLGVVRMELDYVTIGAGEKGPKGAVCARLKAKKDEPPVDTKACITGHRIVSETDFRAINPELTVSLADRLAVLSDPKSGFHRSWPLEVSAIDTVRFPGKVTLMTPVEPNAHLSFFASEKKRIEPYYYDGKPFIRAVVPGTVENPDGTTSPELKKDGTTRWRWSNVGFHIFQNKTFIRAFDSHGCLRLREDDLFELMLFVEAKTTIPLHLHMHALKDFRHPMPNYEEFYQEVRNFGTPEAPRPVKDYMSGEYKKMSEDLRRYKRIRKKTMEHFEQLTVTEVIRKAPDPALIERLEGVSFHDIKKAEAVTEQIGEEGIEKLKERFRRKRRK